MAKKKMRRRRTTSEKVMLVLGILIALSMIFSLIVGLGSGGSSGQALPPDNLTEYDDYGLGTVGSDEPAFGLSSGQAAAGPEPAD